jgi:acetolactate synthase-1/2/3 large subunit
MRNLSEKRTVFETLKVLLFKPVFGTIPRWFKLLNENLTSILSVDEAMLKLFVFNNDGYAMIKISQQNLFDSRISGSSSSSGISFPSFELISKTFEMMYVRISNLEELELALSLNLKSDDAVLFEILMDPDQKYLPRLATSKLEDGSLVSPPLEDLDPVLPIEKLASLLHGEPHKNSLRVRGL